MEFSLSLDYAMHRVRKSHSEKIKTNRRYYEYYYLPCTHKACTFWKYKLCKQTRIAWLQQDLSLARFVLKRSLLIIHNLIVCEKPWKICWTIWSYQFTLSSNNIKNLMLAVFQIFFYFSLVFTSKQYLCIASTVHFSIIYYDRFYVMLIVVRSLIFLTNLSSHTFNNLMK